ncbi:hypothetical protein Slin15195_G021760 [Septoria linicola]|uniref:Antifungal protein n=1 Tax=Septoria linicola TaxID=215465 RepID=A0A9Q9EGI8_9PEZI|nr:hypothetical protein Slin14017_G130230 [Septoria linicola]USW48857.1 hypothetical protein Slin15195_G021760 [Septoria linicola]
MHFPSLLFLGVGLFSSTILAQGRDESDDSGGVTNFYFQCKKNSGTGVCVSYLGGTRRNYEEVPCSSAHPCKVENNGCIRKSMHIAHCS